MKFSWLDVVAVLLAVVAALLMFYYWYVTNDSDLRSVEGKDVAGYPRAALIVAGFAGVFMIAGRIEALRRK